MTTLSRVLIFLVFLTVIGCDSELTGDANDDGPIERTCLRWSGTDVTNSCSYPLNVGFACEGSTSIDRVGRLEPGASTATNPLNCPGRTLNVPCQVSRVPTNTSSGLVCRKT